MRSAQLILVSGFFVSACAPALVPTGKEVVDALPAAPLAPAANPTTPERAELGRLLFWDPILSGDRDVACATCHHPAFGFADGRPGSLGPGGVGLGPDRIGGLEVPRNSPTVLLAAFNGLRSDVHGVVTASRAEDAPMFWDVRVRSLEEQARGPLHAEAEMRGTRLRDEDVARVLADRLSSVPEYVNEFERAFGEGPITEDRVVMAIAAYERTLVPNPELGPASAFDRFQRGDEGALTLAQKRGLIVFFEAGCARCHGGPMFSDFELHALGAGDPAHAQDRGDGQGRFRTPTLRNVTRTAPYMHDGSQATLDDVYAFYLTIDQSLDEELVGLGGLVGSARADLTAFLESLEDDAIDTSVPTSVPSGLPVGGAVVAESATQK